MKKFLKVFFLILLAIVVLPGLIYLGLVIYYQDSFPYGTWINGVYCTGKTAEEVQQELEENFAYSGLKIKTIQDEEFLDLGQLELTYDFLPSLMKYRSEQNPYQWFWRMISGHQNVEMIPEIHYSEEQLMHWLYQTDIYQNNSKLEPDTLEIVHTKEGYRLIEKKAWVLDVKKTKEVLRQGILQAKEELNLVEEECFFVREESSEMKEIRELYQKIEDVQNLSFTYHIKEKEKKITPYEFSLWIATDEEGMVFTNHKGEIVYNKKAISEFVSDLAKEFDSWHQFSFTTHDGKKILLKKGNYGIKIHQKKEEMFLLDWLQEPMETVRIPKFEKDHTYQERNEIDQTYIEIDMSLQKLFYFQQGEEILSTDVVTGCIQKGTPTPEMVCYVYNKSEDAILKGANYRSHVDYWMPIYGGIGIHDADWRKNFGGDIYQKNGSHGCINTPKGKMVELFDKVEVGTPVVVHY